MTLTELKTALTNQLYFGISDQSAVKVICDEIAAQVDTLANTTVLDDFDINSTTEDKKAFVATKMTLTSDGQKEITFRAVQKIIEG